LDEWIARFCEEYKRLSPVTGYMDYKHRYNREYAPSWNWLSQQCGLKWSEMIREFGLSDLSKPPPLQVTHHSYIEDDIEKMEERVDMLRRKLL